MLLALIAVFLAVVSARNILEDLPQMSNFENRGADVPSGQLPVNFRYITKGGYSENQPFDIMQYRTIHPKDIKDAKEFIKKNNNITVRWLPPIRRLTFQSPRDEMEYYKNFYNSDNKTKVNRQFDFSSLLEKNIQDPFANRRSKLFDSQNKRKFPKGDTALPMKFGNVSEYFEENRFYRRHDYEDSNIKWTTCDEFADNAVFHPDDIVNTKWLPFFIWSKRKFMSAAVHTFSYVTKKNVEYFKTVFGPHYKNVDWKQPKLLMSERRKVLLIAAGRKGLFHGIPDQELPKSPLYQNVTLQVMPIRLKIHDPYLAMMYCDENHATIMAELGTEPRSEREAIMEASTLNFKGRGGYVRRDIELEKLNENLNQKRRVEEQAKKYIRLRPFIGDVDRQVKHA